MAAICSLAPASANAQELVKNLFTSTEGQEVNWSSALNIAADHFADGINVGNYLSLKCSTAKEAIELKSDGQWLPGTVNANYGEGTDNVELKVYLTVDGLNALKAHGLEVVGGGMTVTSLDVMSDGFNMPEGAIWGGYCWIDGWKTLELFKTALDSYDGQRYMDIYLSDDNGDNTGYFIQALAKFDDPSMVIAGNTQIAHGTRVASFDLSGTDFQTKLQSVNALLIQSNPEGGHAYNITAVALRNQENVTFNAPGNPGEIIGDYTVSAADEINIPLQLSNGAALNHDRISPSLTSDFQDQYPENLRGSVEIAQVDGGYVARLNAPVGGVYSLKLAYEGTEAALNLTLRPSAQALGLGINGTQFNYVNATEISISGEIAGWSESGFGSEEHAAITAREGISDKNLTVFYRPVSSDADVQSLNHSPARYAAPEGYLTYGSDGINLKDNSRFDFILEQNGVQSEKINVNTSGTTVGIESVDADSQGEALYYNLQGARVANPAAGIYLKVTSEGTSKVILK